MSEEDPFEDSLDYGSFHKTSEKFYEEEKKDEDHFELPNEVSAINEGVNPLIMKMLRKLEHRMKTSILLRMWKLLKFRTL